LFFAFAMLSEPLTTPPTRHLQMWYGALVGFLFVPQVHFGALYFSPEMALVMGNFFSWTAGPKTNLLLTLRQKVRLSPDTFEFVFQNRTGLVFAPGQYMEWTVPLRRADDRGNRRFITLSSAPEEQSIRMGVKFYPRPSTYKRGLMKLRVGDQVAAGHLAGDFVMPKDTNEKLAFVAGGIGITPFASMLRHMLSTGERRNAVLIFANWREEDIAYSELLEQAVERLGIRVVHVLSAVDSISKDWDGRVGFVDERLIREEIADFAERTFYISGPQVMVKNAKQAVEDLGVKHSRIHTDYFPGFS
jgi:ferredoxin-NADP reductase